MRALQMALVLFYAEQLKQQVVDLIQRTDRFRERYRPNETSQRVPEDTKNSVGKALNALVADGAITEADKAEIRELIDYRNLVAHDIAHLVADVSSDRDIRLSASISPERFEKYDYAAVDRLRHFRRHLDGLYRTHHYVTTLRYGDVLFRTAERAFLAEISALKRKIDNLYGERLRAIDALNAEMDLGSGDPPEGHPGDPGNQYDSKRLTRRGEEMCYQLFDQGKSPLAVAHLMVFSLTAARKRKQKWIALGGVNRAKVDLQSVPRPKRRRRRDDW
jgi:hypothetical protein